jgi:trimeric autotransporter adhesin
MWLVFDKRSGELVRTAGAMLLLMGLAALPLLAQSYYGVVRGLVTDQRGGVLVTAKVTIINEGTAEQRSTTTSGSGEYVFNEVIPATYTVVCEAPGFKKSELKGIVLATQGQVTADLKLEVGQVTESVNVVESAPLVESATASQGQVLDNQKLVDLPNLGRNPFMMSKLSQNVVQVGPPAYNRMEDQSGSSMISIAGGPVRGNNYLLDGIPITDANNRAIIIPTLEAVQEVKIQANTYDAEMARTGGGMFNTLMKSGTNTYHGSLYGHLRRTDWDANAFFSNAAGIPITDQPNTTWGASFGGKIWIPHVYDGKNKTFFFLGVEHYDDWSSDSANFNLPTLAERSGDFSKSFVSPGGPLVTVTDPLSGNPFPGNIIPTSRITAVGGGIAATYPNPVTTPAYYGANDLTLSSSIKARAVQYTAKFDEDFFPWWRLSLSYLRYYSLEPGDTWFAQPSTQSGWRLLRRVDTTQLNNVFTLSPTTVVTLRYGFNRFPNFDYNSSQGFNIASLGFGKAYASTIVPAAAEFPQINMTSIYSLGDSGDWDYYDEASHNFSASVDKFVGGRHSLRGGFDYRKLATSGAGINCTTGCYTFNTNSSLVGSNTGVDLADLLLGLPFDRHADTAQTLTDYIPYYAWFVQDNIRFTSKLTVNLGIRWEHEGGVREANNGLLVGFNTTATNAIASQVPSLSLKGAAEYAGVGGAPTSVGDYNNQKWGPRVGAAYQLNSKTVLRGGYGLFWAPQIYLGGPLATPGYANVTDITGKSTTDVLTNPFPNGLLAPVGNSQGAAVGIGTSLNNLVDPQTKSPRVHQYSVDVQRDLGGGVALEVGYVGSHSTHLTLGQPTVNIDALNPSYLSQGATALNASVTNPFYGVAAVAGGTLSGPTVPAFRLLLPYPAYTAINEIFGDTNYANYNSMVIKGTKRFSYGLTFLSTFTWSKNMDESSGGVGSSLNGSPAGAPQNPYTFAGEYSYSNVDTPVRWATSVSYELPIGKGKGLLNTNNRALDLLVGGWVINTVSVYQTGFPLQIYQNNANSQYGYGVQRPNMTSTPPGTSGSVENRLYDYINPAAFSVAPAASFGNTPRTLGSLRGPGEKNWDISIFKNFVIKERLKAQFRTEALNAFNSPYFYSPNTNLSSGTFGQINSQANFARQLQLALRVSF